MNSKKIKLFVYGTLKRGGMLHDYYLGKSEFVKKDFVRGELYALYGLPFLVVGKNRTSKVPGEVYNVSDEVFDEIKKMEEDAGYKTVEVSIVEGDSVYTFSYDKLIALEGKRIKSW
jgi:gamma-glutamylcyclotransferase (GGCT)/AIG2-like uncharacterized protein YtfP